MDIYDKEVELLSEMSPQAIYNAWNEYNSILFDAMSVDRTPFKGNDRSTYYGCASQVSCGVGNGSYLPVSDSDELTKELVAMQLPNFKDSNSLDPKWLPMFAKAQRMADTMIQGRKPPKGCTV